MFWELSCCMRLLWAKGGPFSAGGPGGLALKCQKCLEFFAPFSRLSRSNSLIVIELVPLQGDPAPQEGVLHSKLFLYYSGKLFFKNAFNFRNGYSLKSYSINIQIWSITAMTHTSGSFENYFIVKMIFPEVFSYEHYDIFVPS